MLVNGKHYRTVWMKGDAVYLINQQKLPHSFEIYECKNYRQTAEAIKNMIVRGAPAIGTTAGYALAQAALEANSFEDLEKAVRLLKSTRPTAQELFYIVDRIFEKVKKVGKKEFGKVVVQEANKIADESVKACKKIGECGSKLIKNNSRILTHCNAGWLACVDWGTALSPVYMAKRKGKEVFVFVSETRPWLQGVRLTAWELQQEGIDHMVIVDSGAGYFMQNHEIDLVVVGADRIALNGDTVNKIGTYEKAVLAKENEIPFYVAVPLSTFDLNCKTGKDMPIEERDEKEVLYINKIRIAPKGSKARNPVFDVTPVRYITAFITEKGIVKAKNIRELFSK